MGVQETAFERHYTVDELAELWGMSDDFVRRLFLNEPGVVVFFKTGQADAPTERTNSRVSRAARAQPAEKTRRLNSKPQLCRTSFSNRS